MYSGCAATSSKEDMTYVLNLGINLQVKKMSTIDHVTMNVIQYIKKSKNENDHSVIDKNLNVEEYHTDLDENTHFVEQDIDLKQERPCKIQRIIKEECKQSTISSIENSIKRESSEYYNSTNTLICTNFNYMKMTTDSNEDSMEAIGMKNTKDKTVNDLVTNNSSKFQITNRRVSVGVFSCDVCHRTYTAKPGLNQHKKFECQLKPTFRCSYCLKMFFRKSSLNRHYVSVHKILMFPTKSKQLLKKIDTYNNA
ncbi:zinc finger protein 809-like isoform X2 [Adelges cooleyi]|nr:zinc finger protein 809-like isoform X2 [Adelges cooleyi]